MMINFLHRYISFLILVCVPLIYSFPCPPECICKPTEAKDVDAVRMSYTIDCSHVPLRNHRLQYHAESWSIHEDRQIFYDDPDAINLDYLIALDLSNSLSLKSFGAEAIQLTGATYLLQNLSLASQSNEFQLLADAFNADFYRNLKLLNLSSCCQKIPIQCARLFIPLKELQVLDLSGSDMYKTCLSKPGNTHGGNVFDHYSGGKKRHSSLIALLMSSTSRSDEGQHSFILDKKIIRRMTRRLNRECRGQSLIYISV